MNDIGLMHYFLGMEVWQEDGHVFLGQGKYVANILSRFHMEDCGPILTPVVTNWRNLSASKFELVDAMRYHQFLGSLMYLVNTRPYICFSMNTLSPYVVDLRRVHLIVEKHVLRYITGSMEYGLDYVRDDGVRLIGYTDSDWAGYAVDKKSTSECCFRLGSTIVSWFNHKHKSVAPISAKVEYMATS
jgi:hypothetical protein